MALAKHASITIANLLAAAIQAYGSAGRIHHRAV
jgi:hypothetical protein